MSKADVVQAWIFSDLVGNSLKFHQHNPGRFSQIHYKTLDQPKWTQHQRGTEHLEIKLSWKPNGCPQTPRTGMSQPDKQLLMALLAPPSLWNVTASLNTFGGDCTLNFALIISAELSLRRDCRAPHAHFPLCSHQLSLSIQGGFFFPWDSCKAKFQIPPLRGRGASSWRSTSSVPAQTRIYFVEKPNSPLSTASPCFPFVT